MKKVCFGGAVLLAAAIYSAGASAATVTCGDSSLGAREVTVTGAADPGYCYAQNGNFNGDDLSMIPGAETNLKKNSDWGADFVGGSTSGSWSISSALWTAYDKLYIAFHFGGGGECDDRENNRNGAPGPDCEVDPDSFIVELASGATSGTWTTNWGNQWGLSNLYLAGVCTKEGGCDTTDVPVPGTLGLLGLGLAGLGLVRRRTKA